MKEPFLNMDADRLGYEILTIDGKIFFRRKTPLHGPYSTLDAAAKAAIDDHRKTVSKQIEQTGTYNATQ